MKERNKKQQVEKKRLEQKKLLMQMKQEIELLESEIKHSSLINVKIKTIRNLKITARALQLVAPYVITASIIAKGFNTWGNTPFYWDEKKIYANVMMEFDNVGNIRYEQQYDSFENDKNKLYYYTGWEKNNNGFYSRIIETYSIKEKTYEDIIELFETKDLNLEDIFGMPDSSVKETKNNLTVEELQEESFIKAVIYTEDKNDYLIGRETIDEDIIDSFLYCFVIILVEGLISIFRKKLSSFDFSKCVYDIKRKYELVDIDTITKKLEIKKDNYNRLIR